ncbi:MAG: YceI family protein [Acidimicrobiia bacterium]|nr:YceI family protein [Acidimicrobiia bacterium]
MTKIKWLAVGVLAAVVLVVGGTWVYINVIRDDAPPPLALSDEAEPDEAEPDAAAPDDSSDPEVGDDIDDAPVDGTWVPVDGSVIGYRVAEILLGQSAEAVGRTDQIDGSVTIDATAVTAATFEVDVASIESDDDRRDRQFRGRIMDVANHPIATLVLTDPIELGSEPANGETTTADLTLRGTTRSVEIELEARRDGERIEVLGSIPIGFAEWGIPSPSAPGIDTEDEGLLEFLVVLERS